MSKSTGDGNFLDLSKGIATILIPIIIAVFGWVFSQRQQEVEIQKQYLDRVALLMEDLAGKDSKKRALAIAYMHHLAEKNQIDSALSNSLAEVSLRSSYEDSSYNDVSAQLVQKNFIEVVSKIEKEIRPVVYIHIQNEQQRNKAELIKSNLEDNEFSVPGIELVSVGPANNQLRYFRKREKDEANLIIHKLENAINYRLDSVKIVLLDNSKFLAVTKPRTYELWLKKN